MTMTVADLFAGLGGTTLGATQAGMNVVASANHWPLAVGVHALNHPEVEHFTQDLQQANFHDWPDFDVLAASPACQGHSHARGKDRPHHDATRSTAWAVIAAAEAKTPKFIVVENVEQFSSWRLYPQWESCLQALGYTLSSQVLDAADFGVPQHRRRLFVVGVHQSVGTTPFTHPQGRHKHVPASAILDFGDGSWSPIERADRAPATLARIRNGRARFGDRFLAPYFGSGSGTTGRDLGRPLGTLTTRDRYSLIDGDRMRMLTGRECLRGMGFPDSYRVPTTRKMQIFLAGNAVSPPVARAMFEAIKSYQPN